MSATTATARHTCGGPVFGRKTPGCPRCDELIAGAAPVQWAASRTQRDARDAAFNRRHFDSVQHRSGGCGPVCTYGDW